MAFDVTEWRCKRPATLLNMPPASGASHIRSQHCMRMPSPLYHEGLMRAPASAMAVINVARNDFREMTSHCKVNVFVLSHIFRRSVVEVERVLAECKSNTYSSTWDTKKSSLKPHTERHKGQWHLLSLLSAAKENTRFTITRMGLAVPSGTSAAPPARNLYISSANLHEKKE
eukprot:2265170-Amphidinium_carterae.5